ncbi:MAG: Rieske 2Fe-2S domain-containing protein, partial [Gammaproteobacteria bacterium]|nr:Rieske 2Fe-2S domain-containing protein [Gammaproteobacteria bacterium]
FRGVVVRWQGEVRAYENVCPHAGHSLNLVPTGFFTPDYTQLICSSHGALFAPDTGVCTGGPCAGDALRALECRVEGDAVVVMAPTAQENSRR